MAVLLLYASCVVLPSSRTIEKACWEDGAFRVLSGIQQRDRLIRKQIDQQANRSASNQNLLPFRALCGCCSGRANLPSAQAGMGQRAPNRTRVDPTLGCGPLVLAWLMAEWRITSAEQVVGQNLVAIPDQDTSQLNSRKPLRTRRQLDG